MTGYQDTKNCPNNPFFCSLSLRNAEDAGGKSGEFFHPRATTHGVAESARLTTNCCRAGPLGRRCVGGGLLGATFAADGISHVRSLAKNQRLEKHDVELEYNFFKKKYSSEVDASH